MVASSGATPNTRTWLYVGAALAAVVGVGYFAIALGWVAEGFESPPTGAMVVAGIAYLVGGGLILLADRRLLILGAVINTLVLLAFLASAVGGNATVDAFTVVTKAAQIALGFVLIWLAIQTRGSTRANDVRRGAALS